MVPRSSSKESLQALDVAGVGVVLQQHNGQVRKSK